MTDYGFRGTRPKITRITFQKRNFVTLHLEDGRLVYAPLTNFSGIAELTSIQRRQNHIADGNMVLFRDDDAVYHVQDFLGTYEANAYQSPGKQQKRELVKA